MARSDHILVGVLVVFSVTAVSWACNEAVCASLVSKCMLLKSCECNMQDKNNCTCCKDCSHCLAKLYSECCDCVGMCEQKNPKTNLYKTSTVEELPDPIPGLFNVLTEDEDNLLRWTAYTYPAHLDLLYFKPRGHDLDVELGLDGSQGSLDGAHIRHGHHKVTGSTSYQNCTVAYMSQCMSLNKCRNSCQSMGAASYRWFHDYGCCECIGSTCLDFGKGEALCLKCPLKDEEEEKEVEEEEEEDLIKEEEIYVDIIKHEEESQTSVEGDLDTQNANHMPEKDSIITEDTQPVFKDANDFS